MKSMCCVDESIVLYEERGLVKERSSVAQVAAGHEEKGRVRRYVRNRVARETRMYPVTSEETGKCSGTADVFERESEREREGELVEFAGGRVG